MPSTRRRLVPTEGSWRLVDGENESFDTRYLSSFDEDALSSPPLGSQPTSGYPSQQSFSTSQGGMSYGSQDSIRDFSNYQDDDQVILREPFRPTMPPSITSGSTTMSRLNSLRHNSDIQLRMPRIDIDTDLTSSGGASIDTSRTWRKQSSQRKQELEDESQERYPFRKRRKSKLEQPKKEFEDFGDKIRERNALKLTAAKHQSPKPTRQSLIVTLCRALGVLRLLFGYLIIPFLLTSAVYLFYNSGISIKGLSFEPISFPISLPVSLKSLTPICRIPGASQISLPFCNSESPESQSSIVCNINFEDLVDTQEKFEDILIKGRRGSSIPLDLERSEIATRNLRSLLKDSDVPRKYELLAQLNSYIENVGRAGPDMQAFYIHIGSTADSIVNINRWTLRHISSLSVEPETPEMPPIIARIAWFINLFKYAPRDLHDRILLEKYTEHIVLVQDRLERLADEGSILALLLSHSQNHLSEISNLTKQPHTIPAPPKPTSLLASVWSIIGGIIEDEQRDQRDRLDLLEKVDVQFSSVISYIYEIIEAVKDIHAELADLLRKSVEPTISWTDESVSTAQSTLHEQIDIVKNGLRRLENARRRNA